MKRSEVFPSPYLKSPALGGKPAVLTIERAVYETLNSHDGANQQMVLYFRETTKKLPLNQVNYDSVSTIVGDKETDNWPGHKIEVFPDKTKMQGKITDCVRIRAPQPSAPKQNGPNPPHEIDNSIPF